MVEGRTLAGGGVEAGVRGAPGRAAFGAVAEGVARAEELAVARKALVEQTDEEPTGATVPAWLRRCGAPTKRIALFIAGAGLILDLIGSQLSQEGFADGFLLDGFPRTAAQAAGLDALLEARGERLDVVPLLSVDEQELVQRLLGRARIEGRSDDTEAVIRKRLAVYRSETEPLIDFYRGKELLADVQGKGTPDQVFDRLRSAIRAAVA